jgi:hypothetical protein
MHEQVSIVDAVRRWVQTRVVGLDLCPFAQDPLSRDKVRFVCSRAESLEGLLAELLHEISLLEGDEAEAETTLLIAPALLRDFDDFIDAVATAEALLQAEGLDAHYQLAHFHPDYCFEGEAPADPSNMTNQAPYPALHLLRWKDVRQAMQTHPNVSQIPADNQERLRKMGRRAVNALDLPLALAPYKCWDIHTQAIFEAEGEALEDCILQNRAELNEFAQFIEDKQICSYLEIGIWTGRLVTALQRVFCFETVAAADQGWAETCGLQIQLPPEVNFFRGDSGSPEFERWRSQLGHIDLVLIDGDHRYAGVRRDFEQQTRHPHRFLALHDITGANRWTTGVRRLWSEIEGHKRQIVHPHLEAGIDSPTMGIGIWSATEDPS